MTDTQATQNLAPVRVDPQQPLIILDTETTGLDHKSEEIIEIAAVKLVGAEVVETFESLVKPSTPIRNSSYKIHGISEEMVAEAPSMPEVLPRFLDFVQDYTYVAHNALFDYSFVNEAMKRHLDRKFKNPRIDTLDMYRSVFPDEASHGLSSLLNRFGFESHVDHRALSDALGLAQVYPKLRVLYEEKYAWQFTQLDNINYLVERYLRLQKAAHVLHAEMADLKDVFKLHFAEGGGSVQATSGEMLVSSYRRTYEYDDAKVLPIILEAGLISKTYKLNPRGVDKLIDRGTLVTPEQRQALLEARRAMHEARVVNFVKPQASETAPSGEEAATESSAPAEDS